MKKTLLIFFLIMGIFYSFYDFNVIIPGSPGKYIPSFTFLCGSAERGAQTRVKVSLKSGGEEGFIRTLQRSLYRKLRAKEVRR